MEYQIKTPFTAEKAAMLRAGDTVLQKTPFSFDVSVWEFFWPLMTGARLAMAGPGDHRDPRRLVELIHHAGPAPAKPDAVLGSCGPTTSYHMDAYTPTLLQLGLRGMIGKGMVGNAVRDAAHAAGAVYFAATGGAGALIANCVTTAEIVCYADLGSEAVRRLTVRDFPLTVVLDTAGGNLYESGPQKYLESFSKKD
ncbi:MAG: fumarate hydratase C-terminal domain-containing protein [Ruthenibacterium sp.]